MELHERPDIKRRQAAWAIRELIRHYGLGTQAMTFDPDSPEEWVVDSCYISAIKNRKVVATFTIVGDLTQIEVNDIYAIIRYDKLDEFEPEQYGIFSKTARSAVTNDKYNDIEAELDMPDIKQFTGPLVVIPRSSQQRTPKYIGTLR